MKIRNDKLYNMIKSNYINTETPLTIKEIAKLNNMTEGGVKNFMYRYKLNKKNTYEAVRNKIKELHSKDLAVKDIAKLVNKTPQYVYLVLGEANDRNN